MKAVQNDLPIIAPTRAASLLGVSHRTLINICNRGELECVRDTSGKRLFRQSAIERLRNERDARANAAA